MKRLTLARYAKGKQIARLKHPGKTGVLLILAFLLAAGPAWPAAAEGVGTAGEAGFLQTLRTVFAPVKSHLAGEQPGPAADADIQATVEAINRFSSTVLKDERLARIIDEIIYGFLQDEEFLAGIQDKKVFAAEIIRDPRLVGIVGEVIADFLKDERFTADIEYFFQLIVDLLSHEELHFYIRDAAAALIEDPAFEDTVNHLIAAGIELGYTSGAGAVADFLADEKLPETILEVAALFTDTAPGWFALAYDKRLPAVAEEIGAVVVKYGPELTLNLMEDPRLREVLTDIFLLAIEPIPAAVGGAGVDALEHVLRRASVEVADGTVDTITANMIDDFFHGGAQQYLQSSFNEIVRESMARANAQTPGDYFLFIIPVNIQKQIAEAIAEIPGGIARDGFFTWLVLGQPGLDARTYRDWALDFTGLLTPERAEAFAAAFSSSLKAITGSFIRDNQAHVFDALKRAVDELPWEEITAGIREEGKAEAASELLVSRIIANLPIEELARFIQEDAEAMQLMETLFQEFVREIPFEEAARFIREERQILRAVQGAVPRLELKRVADIIRSDERIVSYVAETAAGFPIGAVTGFLQDERRADLIGRTMASFLLHLSADFVEDEQLAEFIYDVIFRTLDSLEDSPGVLIVDFLSAFLENEQLALYLAESYHELAGGMDRELAALYKLAVPGFFTRFIWKFL